MTPSELTISINVSLTCQKRPKNHEVELLSVEHYFSNACFFTSPQFVFFLFPRYLQFCKYFAIPRYSTIY